MTNKIRPQMTIYTDQWDDLRADNERLNRELDDVWDALAIQREDNVSFGDAFKRMTSEIERLKKEALFTADTVLPDKDAEIERLRAALREYLGADDHLAKVMPERVAEGVIAAAIERVRAAKREARAALAQEKQ